MTTPAQTKTVYDEDGFEVETKTQAHDVELAKLRESGQTLGFGSAMATRRRR